jgi:hypothetical protein
MQIGEFDHPQAAPRFSLDLAVRADDLHASWRRCNMLANYVAEYVAYQFPEREWAENLISTVINEFLEAVVLLAPPGGELALGCRQYEDDLLLELAHPLRPELAEPYAGFLVALGGPDTDALYFAHLSAAERPALAFNQFGLLMLVHDFRARVAARLAGPAGPVVVRISLTTHEIAP